MVVEVRFGLADYIQTVAVYIKFHLMCVYKELFVDHDTNIH